MPGHFVAPFCQDEIVLPQAPERLPESDEARPQNTHVIIINININGMMIIMIIMISLIISITTIVYMLIIISVCVYCHVEVFLHCAFATA